jgi:hypothetical protein
MYVLIIENAAQDLIAMLTFDGKARDLSFTARKSKGWSYDSMMIHN